GDLVLEAECLGRRVGRVRRRGGVDTGDARRLLRESATGELRRLLSEKSPHSCRKEKGHWTGKANGETHGDSLKNTDIRGFCPKIYWFSGFVSTTAAAAGAFTAVLLPILDFASPA